MISCSGLTYTRDYFPPVPETEAQEEHATEPSELASQLPDAPSTDPRDEDEAEQPSPKKQKTAETEDDDFVVVEKEDLKDDPKDDKAKPEL